MNWKLFFVNSNRSKSVTPEEVNDKITNLDEGKAKDSYDIPHKLIKFVR